MQAFHDYITDPAAVKTLTVYGAFEGESIKGVLAIRSGGTHISLFFVDPDHHSQGVGTALMQCFFTDSGAETVTVHSLPYAVEVYRRLGFQPTAAEQRQTASVTSPWSISGGRNSKKDPAA